jgi:HTH-type transcriptional regulator/antitoxin HipB
MEPSPRNFPIGKNEMITDARAFGERVAAGRRRLGLTQRDLALAVGVGERFIVELEAGKPTAQLGKALAAARAAGLRLEDASDVSTAPPEERS